MQTNPVTIEKTVWLWLRVCLLVGLTMVGRAAMAAAPDPSLVPVVHVLATDPAGAERGGDTATFTVYRDGPTASALSVRYELAGSASNGVDYLALSGEVTIAAGASSAPITVVPIDDTLVEGGEIVAVFLAQPAVWPPPYLVCWPAFALGHIEDDDLAPTNALPVVSIVNPPDGSTVDAGSDLVLGARATDRDGRVVAVEFFADGVSLGVARPRPIVIEPVPIPGDPIALSAVRAVDPLVFPDLSPNAAGEIIIGPLERFFLTWSNVPPGAHELVAVAVDNAGGAGRSEPVRIRAIEVPPQVTVAIRATDPVATEPGAAAGSVDTATFVVRRSGSTDLPLTVYYQTDGTAQNGVDYRELPHRVVISAGERTAEIVVVPLPDRVVEGPESVVIAVIPPPCVAIFPPPPECYGLEGDGQARAVINDNDVANQRPEVALVRPLAGSVFLAPADVELVAEARDSDGRVVTVEFFEGANSLGRVTNDWRVVVTNRPVYALKWPDVKPGRYVLTAVATDDDGAMGRSQPVDILVADPVARTVVTVAAVDAEAAEVPAGAVANPAVFAVKRSGGTDGELLVNYSLGGTAQNGVDYRLLSGVVRIPAGADAARVVVEPIDDRLVEGAESVGITIEPPICIAIFPPPPGCYLVGAESQARAVILDNDLVNTNLPPRVALMIPAAGAVFDAPASIAMVAATGDPDGWVRMVEFYAGAERVGVVTNDLPIAVPGVAGGVDPVLPPDQLFRFVWDNVPAGDYALRARATDNRGATTWSEPVRVHVVDNYRLPLVTIEATDAFATEGLLILDPSPVLNAAGNVGIIGPPIQLVDTATFTVKRDRGTNNSLTVFYQVAGTASNGVDYPKLTGEVVIPAGALAATITVRPIEDLLVEGTETVVLELLALACPAIVPPPPSCYEVGDPARAVAFIRDNDRENQPAKVELIKPENNQIVRFGADVDVVAAVVDPDGYVSEVKFFANGRLIGRDQQIFLVAPPPGQPQRFSMVWSNPPAGRFELVAEATDSLGLVSRSAGVVIAVVEPCLMPVVTLDVIDPVAMEQDPRVASVLPPDRGAFRVSRSCNTNVDLHVHYEVGGTAANGVDYGKLEGVVRIPAGSWSADIVVDPLDDDLVEGTETVVVKLVPIACVVLDPNGSPAILPIGCYTVGSAAAGVVELRDNEPARPRVAIVEPGAGEQFRAGSRIPIVAQAVDPDGWVGLVEFFANDRKIGQDQIVFIQAPPPGQLQRFSMVWENVPAGRYVLTARATDAQGETALSAPVGIVVVDGPALPVVTIFAVDPLAREGAPANPASFRVRRSGGTNEALVVHYVVRGTAENGVDYRELSGVVTIPAGRHSARVAIVPVDDGRVERFETVILALAESGDYRIGRPGRAGALLLDNDCPRPETCALAGGDFHLRRGPDGLRCYRVEVSGDLGQWEALGSNVLDDDAVHFVDPEAGDWPQRFYRVVPCADVEVPADD